MRDALRHLWRDPGQLPSRRGRVAVLAALGSDRAAGESGGVVGVTVMTLWPVDVEAPIPGGVRHSDPLPSRLAASDKANQMRWGSTRARLLRVFAAAPDGGLTDDRAAKAANPVVDRHDATKRISEMLRSGLLVDTGVYGVSLKSNTARKCTITPEGRAALAALKAKAS